MSAAAAVVDPVDGHTAASTAAVLRRGLLWLTILGTVGTAVELVLLRHWNNGLQVIPFAAIAVLGLAIVLVTWRPDARRIVAARALSSVVLATSVIGVVIHVRANYEAAPLDFRYSESWPTTPELFRWLLAATDTVGPSPTMAPAALAFMALVLLLATFRHPSNASSHE